MAHLKRVGKFGNVTFLILASTATAVFGGACTLLLGKEPLTCATNSDCAKFAGTVCDQASLECRPGEAIIDGATLTDAETGGPTDGPIPFDGGDPCLNPNKQVVELKGDLNASMTLGCDKDYVLVGRVAVVPPFVLTIAPGTSIFGDPNVDVTTGSAGTLVIPPGARILAVGEKNKPIIFTSGKKLGGKYSADSGGVAAGDWGGVYILGEAPTNATTGTSKKIGLEPWENFGGAKTNSDSGRLEYVRIEYGGARLPGGLDGTTLELAGVGDQTVIDHVQSRFSGNDCVEVLGGRATIKHFLCQYPADDGIAWDIGWQGKAQFVVIQARPGINDSACGLQGRTTAPAGPYSEPVIYNATFCGQNGIPPIVPPGAPDLSLQYAVRLEKYSRGHILNSVFMGWGTSAIDLRGSGGSIAADVAANVIEIKGSVAFGNLGANVAFLETETTATVETNPMFDDDQGFDELAWFRLAANNNSEIDPGIAKCFDPRGPTFASSAPINPTGAAQPPNDGFFDPTAKYAGAFKDQSDTWATGKWVLWDNK